MIYLFLKESLFFYRFGCLFVHHISKFLKWDDSLSDGRMKSNHLSPKLIGKKTVLHDSSTRQDNYLKVSI